MSYSRNYVICNAINTEWGVDFIKKLDLSRVKKITVHRPNFEEVCQPVQFWFDDGDVFEIRNALTTGYYGTGPWAFHDLLIEMGKSEKEASEVFEKKLDFMFNF